MRAEFAGVKPNLALVCQQRPSRRIRGTESSALAAACQRGLPVDRVLPADDPKKSVFARRCDRLRDRIERALFIYVKAALNGRQVIQHSAACDIAIEYPTVASFATI
jgi:hypothetical protein